MTNKANGTLYIGVTNDIHRRVQEHKDGTIKGFTQKYGLKRLVYYEEYKTPEEAIQREKNMKAWNRQWKINAIESANPTWTDLSISL